MTNGIHALTYGDNLRINIRDMGRALYKARFESSHDRFSAIGSSGMTVLETDNRNRLPRLQHN